MTARKTIGRALALSATGSGALLAAGCGAQTPARQSGTPAGGGPVTYAAYPALNRSGASGIAVVQPAQARAAATTRTSPLWVSEHVSAQLATPEIASAREVAREGGARIWIARSSRGGICVLSFRPELASDPARFHSVGASCGASAGLARGAVQFEHASRPRGRWLVSGVAPREVTAVVLHLAGGGTRTLPVANNSYSTAVGRQIVGLSYVRTGIGH